MYQIIPSAIIPPGAFDSCSAPPSEVFDANRNPTHRAFDPSKKCWSSVRRKNTVAHKGHAANKKERCKQKRNVANKKETLQTKKKRCKQKKSRCKHKKRERCKQKKGTTANINKGTLQIKKRNAANKKEERCKQKTTIMRTHCPRGTRQNTAWIKHGIRNQESGILDLNPKTQNDFWVLNRS